MLTRIVLKSPLQRNFSQKVHPPEVKFFATTVRKSHSRTICGRIGLTGSNSGQKSGCGKSHKIGNAKRACVDWCGQLPGRQLLPRLFPKLSVPEYAWIGGLPTIRSYVNKATDGRHKRNKTGKRWETIQHCVLWEFGTNSVQLRERKSGSLASMRHQMKHLDFLSSLLESRRSSPSSYRGSRWFL